METHPNCLLPTCVEGEIDSKPRIARRHRQSEFFQQGIANLSSEKPRTCKSQTAGLCCFSSIPSTGSPAGQKAMAVRFQAPPQPGRPLLDSHLRQLSMPPTMHSLPGMQHSFGALNSLSLPQYTLTSLNGRPAPAPTPRHFSLPTMPGTNPGLNPLFPRRQAEVPSLGQAGDNLHSPCPVHCPSRPNKLCHLVLTSDSMKSNM